MAVYYTSLSDILRLLKDRITAARGERSGTQLRFPHLAKTKLVKVGPLQMMAATQYPAVVILPETNQITRQFSGHVVDVSRQVIVYTVIQAGSRDAAESLLMPVVQDVREAIQRHYQLPDHRNEDRVFRMVVGDLNFEGVEQPKTSLLWMASQRFQFLSKWQMPTDGPVFTEYRESTPTQLMDEVRATFNAGKSIDLSAFNGFQYWQSQIIPTLDMPTLVITEGGESTVEQFSGQDMVGRQFQAMVWEHYSAKEGAVYRLCDLSETVRDYIYKHSRFRNRVTDTVIGAIGYTTVPPGGPTLLQASIPFFCRTRQQVSYAT